MKGIQYWILDFENKNCVLLTLLPVICTLYEIMLQVFKFLGSINFKFILFIDETGLIHCVSLVKSYMYLTNYIKLEELVILSVLFRFTASDYPFSIYKNFLGSYETAINGPNELQGVVVVVHGSWIYNYMCNQCLSLLKLWVRTPFMARGTRYNIMW